MKPSSISKLGMFVLSGTLTGCIALPRDAGLRDVQDAVRERSGFTIDRIDQDAESAIDERIRGLLQGELSETSAVEIALLANRRFQATLEDLGIARGELWQAGLARNPVVGGEIRSPGRAFEIFFVQDVLDLIRLPKRRRQAAAAFEQAKLRVADEVFDLVTEVRQAYFRTQAASQMVAMRQTVVDAAQAGAELAIRQYDAGNISDLQLENEQALLEQAKLELALSQEDQIAERERLNSLMGLWGEQTTWRIGSRLPDVPDDEADLDGLESLAAAQRLDLAAARREVEIALRALPLARLSAFELEAGVHREREPEGGTTTGPSLDFAVPIFDRGGAARSRAGAVLRQARQRLAALAVEIRSEVRAARAHMLAARSRAAYYQRVVLPRRSRIVDFSRQEYNFMLIGAFQLLQARQNEIEAQHAYIESLREYWIARSDLEHAVGGQLTASEKVSVVGEPATEPGPDKDHDRGKEEER